MTYGKRTKSILFPIHHADMFMLVANHCFFSFNIDLKTFRSNLVNNVALCEREQSFMGRQASHSTHYGFVNGIKVFKICDSDYIIAYHCKLLTEISPGLNKSLHEPIEYLAWWCIYVISSKELMWVELDFVLLSRISIFCSSDGDGWCASIQIYCAQRLFEFEHLVWNCPQYLFR